MLLRALHIPFTTGGIPIIVMNERLAHSKSFRQGDRIQVSYKNRKVIATLDTTRSAKLAPVGFVGCFDETWQELKVKSGAQVVLEHEKKPQAIFLIQKKLRGGRLSSDDFKTIIQSIVNNEITDIEMTYFVCACYAH
ncbi:MAG TPA: hypothetical protein VK158_06120, partial [Acidobacteriota bacterium]|nr:hypothetical protein [Acidobacteriota bacterium]